MRLSVSESRNSEMESLRETDAHVHAAYLNNTMYAIAFSTSTTRCNRAGPALDPVPRSQLHMFTIHLLPSLSAMNSAALLPGGPTPCG
jgi:hypothetical protein